MPESLPIVVGLGEVVWDLFPHDRKFGGAPGNFACIVSELGCAAHVVSAVGADELGKLAILTLAGKGVGTDCVQVADGFPTGIVTVRVSSDGQPSFEIESDAAWDHLVWSQRVSELAGRCDAVCFGTLGQRSDVSRETIQKFLRATNDNCLRVLDVNLRQEFYDDKLIYESLELANVLKLNDTELPVICNETGTGGDGLEAQLADVADKFDLRLVALTAGSQGATLCCNGEFSKFRMNESVEVCDTVGAGDAFIATTIFGCLAGWSLDQVNQRANEVAAFVCSQQGATPSLPKELLDRVLGE